MFFCNKLRNSDIDLTVGSSLIREGKNNTLEV